MITKPIQQRAKSANRPSSINYQISSLRLQTLDFPSIPLVTAYSWAIHDANTGDLLWEKRGDDQKEMASLTKIMTCLLCHSLLEKFSEDPENLVFTVNRVSAWVNGTHSGLREGDQVNVTDLFYGLMLPSGNDCALTLAYGFGHMLCKRRKNRNPDGAPVSPVKEFIKEMNKFAMKLGLKNTHYANCHGLSEKGNRSSANDLGRLAFVALQFSQIEKIVSTRSHSTYVKDVRGNQRLVVWTNTNKLLEKGFCGIKTGVTPNAGPCLSSMLRDQNAAVIVTLLNCKSLDHRFTEAEKLAQWALHNISSVKEKLDSLSNSMSPKKLNPRMITSLNK